jgi:hypothetical protein
MQGQQAKPTARSTAEKNDDADAADSTDLSA